jgi:hypothetical protein
MIELNCTYEESKKILELGYDFGRNFGDVYKKRDCFHKYILVNYEKIKALDYCRQVAEKYHNTYLERFTLERLSIDYEDSLYNSKHNEYFELGEIFYNPNSEGFVPLIPKTALEACLLSIIVDTKQGRIYYLSYDGHKTPNYRYRYETPAGIELADTDYSAFEAFLWLYENYPEELKKKFDEVMA